jgi:hypothetical protein
LDTILDSLTVLLPKNSKASKISGRRKDLNIRIQEKEERNFFFKLGHYFHQIAVHQIAVMVAPGPPPRGHLEP